MSIPLKTVLFAGQSYYHAWYLSRELRKLGWKADLLNWVEDESLEKFYHGEDIKFSYKTQDSFEAQIQFYVYALNAYEIFHFSNTRCMTFGPVVKDWVEQNFPGYNEISLLKKLGKKIVYSNNGCHDGVKLSTFRALGTKWMPTCDICFWNKHAENCSDELCVAWGEFRNSMADYQVNNGGNRHDYNVDPRVHDVPEFYCLDPDFWHPALAVPDQYRLDYPAETVKIYHAVASFNLRTGENNANIKCTHIYQPLIQFLKAIGYPVEMIFAKDIPSRDVRFLQVQSDIVVDMLTFGNFGANIREAMMLGKPVVCYMRPEWLESMRHEIPDYVDELPVISATPQTIYDVLKDLIEHPEKRREIGRLSREFALKWHSATAGARRFDRIYSELLGISAFESVLMETDHLGSETVDNYWNDFTVLAPEFRTAQDSLNYLEWRFEQYPYFQEFMGLYGDHAGHTVLDYGCGPGNDLVGFLAHSRAEKVIGVDVSLKALDLATKRIALHRFPACRYELIHVSDTEPAIPLSDESVDHIYCEGVLHHTSDPLEIMKEFRRILKPSGTCCIMVYNRNSIWYHLYTAYQKMIVENAFPGANVDEAFRQNIDGDRCPIARAYDPLQFTRICNLAGFAVEYRGGYLSKLEMDLLLSLYNQALADFRLPQEHKDFISELSYDMNGYPLYQGRHAGVGGVYWLTLS